MPQPAQIDEISADLIDVYARVWDRVVAEQDAIANDPAKFRRRARLAEVQQRIDSVLFEADDAAEVWLNKSLPKVYALGVADGAAGSGGSPIWSQIHQEAVENLAQSLFNDLLAATKNVSDTTKALIRTVARDEALQKAIEGKTATQAGTIMRRILEKQGIHAVTYADGSKHGLREYSQMAIRTKTATAYNVGSLNAATANGVQFWECFDGPDCGWTSHEDTEKALGRIVTRDEALGWPISHPNCRRSFGPRPDLDAKPDGGKGTSLTPEQIAAQKKQDAERLAAQQRRAARARKSGKSKTQGQSPMSDRVAARDKRVLNSPYGEAQLPSPTANYIVNGIDYGTEIKSIEQLVKEGWDPEKAIKEHKRLKANAASKASKARAKLKAQGIDPGGAPAKQVVPKTSSSGELWQKLIAEDQAALEAGELQPKLIWGYGNGIDPATSYGVGSVTSTMHWSDALANIENTTGIIPVHNVRVDGVLVQNGIAIKRNGVAYLWEAPPGVQIDDAFKDLANNQLQALEAALPADLRQYQKSFAMLRQTNPDDAHWAKAYGTPGFKSAATGGKGHTTFWDTKPKISVVYHELGHNLDSEFLGTGKAFTDGPAWKVAQKRDALHIGTNSASDGPFATFSELGAGYVDQSKGITLVTPTTGVDKLEAITSYGGNNSAEDFAESLRLYLRDQHNNTIGQVVGDTGYVTQVRFADRFPERARLLDEITGRKTYDNVTPFMEDAVKEATAAKRLGGLENVVGMKVEDFAVRSGIELEGRPVVRAFLEKELDKLQARATILELEKQAKLAAEAAAKAEKAAKVAQAQLDLKKFVGKVTPITKTVTRAADTLPKTKYDLPKNVQASIASAKSKYKSSLKAAGITEPELTAKVLDFEQKEIEKRLVAAGLKLQTEQMISESITHFDDDLVNTLKALKEAEPPLFRNHEDLMNLLAIEDETIAQQLWSAIGGLGGPVADLETLAEIDDAAFKAGRKFMSDAKKTGQADTAVGGYNLSGDAQKAKATIDRDLAERLADDKEAWEAFRRAQVAIGKPDLPAFDTPGFTRPRRVEALRKEIAERVQTWASTSGDNHPRAVAMQMAIKEEFGTGGDAAVRMANAAERAQIEELYKGVRDWYRTVARAMYDNTQEEFRRMGITHVEVFRGMGTKAWTTVGTTAKGIPIVRPNLQPANSWSTSRSISTRFGRNMLVAKVPVERILGSARTGFGCLNEKEFVILESKGVALDVTSHTGIM